jgi:histidinol-phosphate aminotransferase
VPTFRPDLSDISPYLPGRSIEEVAREHGFDPAYIVKLASNESPIPPLEPVQERIRALAAGVNRYPDNDAGELRSAIGRAEGLDPDHVWVGAGSSELLRVIASAVGGPGTSAVYAWPSFVVYRLASILAMSDRVEVQLVEQRHDLAALAAAIRDDTTVVYLCNPNNPTGTHVGAPAVAMFVEQVPDRVLVVIDEAYHEFVTAEDHATAVPLALRRPNVIVTRTFSKIHGLASLRVGYAIGQPATISELRRAQAPFTVTTLGQAAAIESLAHPAEIAERKDENQRERRRVETALAGMGIDFVPSQGNFVYFDASRVSDVAGAYLGHGIIVRTFRNWVRMTIGTVAENERALAATASVFAGGSGVPSI